MPTNPTPAQFRRRTVAAFRRANPDADATGIAIVWTRQPETCRFADGSTGLSGTINVAAAEHRPRSMVATWSPTIGLMVR